MPNTKSAERRARSNERKHLQNNSTTSRLATLEGSFRARLKAGDKPKAAEALLEITSALDKAAKTRVIHKSAASRRKSRLTLCLNRMK